MEIVFELLTIYFLNPIYILITNNLCYGVIQLISFIGEYKDDDEFLILLHFLCQEFAEIFALIGYLVYLEIIELGFCGLKKDLRRIITERGDNEIYLSLNTIIEENKEDEEEKENNNEKEEN